MPVVAGWKRPEAEERFGEAAVVLGGLAGKGHVEAGVAEVGEVGDEFKETVFGIGTVDVGKGEWDFFGDRGAKGRIGHVMGYG